MSMMEAVHRFLVTVFVIVNGASSVVIVTPLGPVEGELVTSYDGADYHAFNGIPYARPPVGQLRFAAPRPARPWKDIYKPPTRSLNCVQEVGGYISGDEDCLYVHVYTPVNSSAALEVMAYVHGGGYKTGSANLKNEVGYLIAKGVIVVSISYRLGPFGFLSTEDAEAPGNYGLQDILTALVWIHQNIASFGGDPKHITMFGSGSGAALIHFLMLSPIAKGLFHQAILQSGSAINPSSLTQMSLIRAQTLAEKLECPKSPSTQLLKCLRQRHAQEVAYAGMPNFEEVFGMLPLMWAPRIDREAQVSFLPMQPMELMRAGLYNKIPIMAGFVRDEGLVMYGTDETEFETQYGILKNNFEFACKQMFNVEEFVYSKGQVYELCTKIKRHYVERDRADDLLYQRYIDLIGDVLVRSGIIKSLKEMSDRGYDLYVYSFDFFDKRTDTYERSLDGEDQPVTIKGVTHGRELDYIFNRNLYEPDQLTSRQKNMIEIMTTAWTSFAKSGVPEVINRTSVWRSFTESKQRVMSLKLSSKLRKDYRTVDMDFIEELMQYIWYRVAPSFKEEL